jgi:hypothetical protein
VLCINTAFTSSLSLDKHISQKQKLVKMYNKVVRCPIAHEFGTYFEYKAMGYKMLKAQRHSEAKKCFRLAMNLYLNRASFVGVSNSQIPKGYKYVRGADTLKNLVQQHAPNHDIGLPEEYPDLYKQALQDEKTDPDTPSDYSVDSPSMESATSNANQSRNNPSSTKISTPKFKSVEEAAIFYDKKRREQLNNASNVEEKWWRINANNTKDWWKPNDAHADASNDVSKSIADVYASQLQEQRQSLGQPEPNEY